MNKLDRQIRAMLLKDAPKMPEKLSAHFDETILQIAKAQSDTAQQPSLKAGLLRKPFRKSS